MGGVLAEHLSFRMVNPEYRGARGPTVDVGEALAGEVI
jgi:hypothetical protein